MAQAAHAFRGAAGNFGPSAAVILAAEIERLARDGKLEEAAPLCGDLEKEAGALRQLLGAIREEVALCTS